MKSILNVGVLALASVIGAQAMAQEKPVSYVHPEVPAYAGWGWHLGVEHLAIDSAVAKKEKIRDSATAFNLGADYYMADKPFEFHMGLSLIQYGDHAEFEVHGCWEGGFRDGDCGSEKSDASAMQVFGDFGLRKRFGPNFGGFYTVRGGYGAIFGSERAVDNCKGVCGGSDIDVSGGLYGLVGIGFNATKSFSMGLNYKQYLSGDLDSAFALDLRWAY